MQTLKLANDLFPGFEDETKRCTIRAGRRDIEVGPLLFESTQPVNGKFLKQKVFVTEIRYTMFGLISDEIAQMDGCPTSEVLKLSMRRFYPHLISSDTMTIVIFDILKKDIDR